MFKEIINKCQVELEALMNAYSVRVAKGLEQVDDSILIVLRIDSDVWRLG